MGAYRLRETGIPDGYVSYNPNTDFFVELSSQTHTLIARMADGSGEATCEAGTDDDGNSFYTITIPNTPGTELPHSGGAGTTLIYVVGSALVAVGALYLVRQRKCVR